VEERIPQTINDKPASPIAGGWWEGEYLFDNHMKDVAYL
jgi:hypothetical protein